MSSRPRGGKNPIVVVNFVFVECKKSFLPATMTLPHNSTMFTGIKKEKKKKKGKKKNYLQWKSTSVTNVY